MAGSTDFEAASGWGEFTDSMRDPSFPAPGFDARNTGIGISRPPRSWYKNWSLVFSQAPENRIFPDTTSVGVINADMITLTNVAFAVEQAEYAVNRDLENMDQDGAYISTALDTISDAAIGIEMSSLTGGNKVPSIDTEDERISLIAEDLFKRIGFHRLLWQAARDTLHFGNSFYEIILDESTQSRYQQMNDLPGGCIVRLGPRPWYQMFPRVDLRGNRLEGYVQKGRFQGRDQVIEYDEWQVLHFYVGKLVRCKGTALFSSVRRDYKKLQYLEEGLILARISRSYPKLVFKIPIPVAQAGDADAADKMVKKFQDELTRKRQIHRTSNNLDSVFNPTDVTTDFYVARYFHLQPGSAPIDTEVELLESQGNYATDIADILHLQDKIITRSRVPRRYYGLEEKAGSQQGNNQAGGEDVQFVRIVKTLQWALTDGVRKLVNQELICHGIDPEEAAYEVHWPPVSTVDRLTEADVMVKATTAASQLEQVLASGTLPVGFLLKYIIKFPQEDLDRMVSEIEEGQRQAQEKQMEMETTRAAAYNNPDYAEATGYGAGAPAQGNLPQEEPSQPPVAQRAARTATERGLRVLTQAG